MKSRGFVVHTYADYPRDRLYLIGRLEDGRSFAAAECTWRPSLHIREEDRDRAEKILSTLKCEICAPELEAFDGRDKLLLLKFSRFRDYSAAVRLLEAAGITSPDGDLKPPEAYLVRHHIRGPVEIEGDARPGRLLDLVFPAPNISSPESKPAETDSARYHAQYRGGECSITLKVASVDIETDVEDESILAVSIKVDPDSGGLVRVLRPPGILLSDAAVPKNILFHSTEASLLEAFLADVRRLDPDVITGWNFLDFDFPRLADRCAFNRIPFKLGRSGEEAKYFPPSLDESIDESGRGEGSGTGEGEAGARSRRRSAAALVPGRQVLDALRIFRSSPRAGGNRWDASSFTLETVSRSVLGESKLVEGTGGRKIAELKELYRTDPVRFGEYCLRDAELVLKIFGKTGLFALTVERASLTGVSLDKAWTSVVSFERIYGMELHRRGIAPVPLDPRRSVSGAAGGTVLDPMPGLFRNVAVFDFRSLYPSIMLTFNVDPLAHARAHDGTDAAGRAEGPVVAPNGAAFSREKGILPELISGYFAARRRALEAGDEEASFVYKILMNSFYGVMGTPSCRYGRTELAGAITSFARKWLHFSRDWFTAKGYRVLYGDTDSLFVETGLGDGTDYSGFLAWGKSCAVELNAALAKKVLEEYALESCMELRFEKPYRRFMIPHLRNTGRGAGSAPAEDGRGRAKGYGGYLLDPKGGVSVEVKGMEAVRSDYTPLARRIQIELLELVFSGGDEQVFKDEVNSILGDLRLGKLDSELVYRKRLSRNPETYTASTPPQVKAARALGWKNRRGTVEYVWTINGPEPSADENGQSLPHSPLDYDHYAESQVLPAARSIAGAAGWNAEIFPSPGRDFFRDGQLELGW